MYDHVYIINMKGQDWYNRPVFLIFQTTVTTVFFLNPQYNVKAVLHSASYIFYYYTSYHDTTLNTLT